MQMWLALRSLGAVTLLHVNSLTAYRVLRSNSIKTFGLTLVFLIPTEVVIQHIHGCRISKKCY
jgi:hypothetical protein